MSSRPPGDATAPLDSCAPNDRREANLPLDPLRPWAHRASCCEQREAFFEVAQLSVRYGATPALRDVSVALPRGCVTAIVGPSGCGKSTFLTCLNRMTDLVPTCHVAGTVRFEGTSVYGSDVDIVALRRRVGMIFQRPNPFPLSILANLTFPLRHHGLRSRTEREHRAEQALRRVGLWDEVSGRLEKSALLLSGGQQQRLCLARALVLEPAVILLDEPCSALDPLSSGVVEDLILSLRGSYTVIVVTHNLPQARRIADDVALFWHLDGAGTLVEHNNAQALFEHPQHQLTSEYVRGIRG